MPNCSAFADDAADDRSISVPRAADMPRAVVRSCMWGYAALPVSVRRFGGGSVPQGTVRAWPRGRSMRWGAEGVQYDSTIHKWHTCPNSGKINASNPCSEYAAAIASDASRRCRRRCPHARDDAPRAPSRAPPRRRICPPSRRLRGHARGRLRWGRRRRRKAEARHRPAPYRRLRRANCPTKSTLRYRP